MANIKLDLSKFKHLSSDDKSTTLKHYEGHTLTLAHNKLSKVNQDQLKAMANLSKGNEKNTDKSEAKADQQMRQPQEAPAKMAEGGGVGGYLDRLADKVSGQKPAPTSGSNPQTTIKGTPAQKRNPMTDEVPSYKDGGDVQPQEDVQDQYKQAETADVPKYLAKDVESQDITNFDPNQQIQEVPPEAEYKKRFDEYKKTLPNQPDQTIDRTVLRDMAERNDQIANRQASDEKAKAADKYEGEYQQETQGMADQAYDKRRMQAGLPPVSAQVPQASQQQMQQAPAMAPVAVAPPQEVPQQPQQPAAPASVDLNDPMAVSKAGVESSLNAAQGIGAAQSQLAQGELKARDDYSKQQALASTKYQEDYNKIEKERQNLIQDINDGHINPEKFWTGDANGNGSHSRIMAGIGMILAGFNPSNQPNAAINFLKNQMDMNLRAQEKNLDSKQNLLAANLRQFGNLKDAREMARLQQADMVANDLGKAAAKAGTPMAAAMAEKAKGEILTAYAPTAMNLAMRQSMLNMAGDPAGHGEGAIKQMIAMKKSMGDLAGASDLEKHYIPGVGFAGREVSPADLTSIAQHKSTNDTFQKALQIGQMSPKEKLTPTVQAQAGVIQSNLIAQIKQLQHDGVYKESEAEFLLKQLGGSPASLFSSFSSEPKIKQLMQLQNNEYRRKMDAFGVRPFPGAEPQQPQHVITNAKTGQKMGLINGKWSPL